MVVPDDPFARPSPIIRVTSEGDLTESPPRHDSPQPGSGPGTGSGPNTGAFTTGPSTPPPGTRTPRRVQWTADHVVNVAPITSETADLDDRELDHANLSEVNDALERFRRRRNVPSQLSVASMASSDTGDEHSHPHHLHLPHMHTYPPQGPQGRSSEEDYDYRLDTDPMPKDDEEEQEQFAEDILDSGINEHLSGDAHIPLGETDGLPSLPTDARQGDMDAAKNLVRAHTGKWGVLRRRVKNGEVKHTKSQRRQRIEHNDEKPRRSDDSETPLSPPRVPGNAPLNPPLGGHMPHIPGGTSVLSSLMALYQQQQHQHYDSEATTPASSRPPSVASSDDGHDGATKLSGFKAPWKRKGTASPSHSKETSREFGEHKRNKSSTSIADRDTTSPPPGLLNSFQKAYGHFRESDRPKAARSGAGVFGALMQNTGSFAAVAAPASATLMPSAKRPGYHLNRYSLGDINHAPSSPGASRPSSVYSATVVGHSPSDSKDGTKSKDDSDEHVLPVSKSADNLVMMKEKKPMKKLKSLETSALKGAQKLMPRTPARSGTNTPGGFGFERFDSHTPLTEDEQRRKEWEAEKRRRKKAKEARKKQEVFIIQHVAAILARQQFLLKLARALMMFGSPTHRLETQIQATARVLEINAQVVYLPGTMLVSFGDDATHTSETKFLKQGTGLDLGKLLDVHNVYWDVVHDRISVDDASKTIDQLMMAKPCYNVWQTILVGGFCSAFIVVPSFYGSFIDALMCAPLGMLLVGIQLLAAKNDLFSNVFEITIATIISFVSAVLGSTHYFCYTALVSGGVVLILPGYIVLSGALEIASRNITAGAVRIGYSVIYSLFLGFGISIGAEIYSKMIGKDVINATDWTCANTHYAGAPWYLQTPGPYWYFLCVPGYSLVLSLRNQQPIFRKELLVMVIIACAGWVTNHFSAKAFPNRSDIISALGSFAVGLLGNMYGRFVSNGAAFPVMVTGILFQLPSGLSAGGIFNFASVDEGGNSTDQYSKGFSVAQQLVSVAIGLTVGLFVAAVVTHPLGGSRRRGAGIFSF